MHQRAARRKRFLLAPVAIIAALTAVGVAVVARLASSQPPTAEIFGRVSASDLGPGITMTLPGTDGVNAISEEQARRAVLLGQNVDEIRLVRFRDTSSVPTIDRCGPRVGGLSQRPTAVSGGPAPYWAAAAAKEPTPEADNTFWLVVVDARARQFATAIGGTK